MLPGWYRILVQGTANLASKRPLYLVRRKDSFYFRRALPLRLHERFGRAEIKVSLRTSESRTAEMRARMLTNRFVQLTSLVERMPELTPEVINRIVRDAFTQGLENIREVVRDVSEDGLIDTSLELSEAKEAYAALQQRLMSRDYEKITEIEAREFLEDSNIVPPAIVSDEWDALCHGLTRARAEGFRIYAAMLEGRYDDVEPKDPLFKGPVNAVLGQAAPTSGPTVVELANQFIDLKSKAEWKKKTQLDNIRVLRWFREMAGEKRSITSISKADVQDFRDLLMALPKNYAKAAKYDGLFLKQIVEVGADEDIVPLFLALGWKELALETGIVLALKAREYASQAHPIFVAVGIPMVVHSGQSKDKPRQQGHLDEHEWVPNIAPDRIPIFCDQAVIEAAQKTIDTTHIVQVAPDVFDRLEDMFLVVHDLASHLTPPRPPIRSAVACPTRPPPYPWSAT